MKPILKVFVFAISISVFGLNCQAKMTYPRLSVKNECRPSVLDLIQEYDEGYYRPATGDETVDLLECVELLGERNTE